VAQAQAKAKTTTVISNAARAEAIAKRRSDKNAADKAAAEKAEADKVAADKAHRTELKKRGDELQRKLKTINAELTQRIEKKNSVKAEELRKEKEKINDELLRVIIKHVEGNLTEAARKFQNAEADFISNPTNDSKRKKKTNAEAALRKLDEDLQSYKAKAAKRAAKRAANKTLPQSGGRHSTHKSRTCRKKSRHSHHRNKRSRRKYNKSH
jgi:hypothetical protein